MIDPVPKPPHWLLDWDGINEALPWIRALRGCPQDPIHHTEGDVWIHQQMVLEALIALPAWRALPEPDRVEVFWGALLHDVAKPATTAHEGERITARGHSRKGAIMAREILWRLNLPFASRERICQLVRHHQVPFWLLERDDPERLLTLLSWGARPDHLAILAEADLRGRHCQDAESILTAIGLFAELAHELACLDQPRSVVDGNTRFLFAKERWSTLDFAGPKPGGSHVWLMSGMPGAGKDTWLRLHLKGTPSISLDDIRKELGIGPKGTQGKVIQTAKERARQFLRKGETFSWNATNLGRRMRQNLIDLFVRYDAHVHIVYVETSADQHQRQNRRRDQPVPESSLTRMLQHWEVPTVDEAHEVIYAVTDASP